MTRMQWQVINKLGLTQHKQTHTGLVKPLLWNMHMTEFLVVTACGLDITVQGHFLRCAPLQLTPPPPHFLYTQTKAASLGKVLGHFCFYVKPAPCSQADSLVDTMCCLQTAEHFSISLMLWDVGVAQKKHASQHFHKQQRCHIGPKGQRSSLSSIFDMAVG